MKDKYHEQWENLGATDPYWAVLTNPKKRGGKWNHIEFFATGEREVIELFKKLDALDIELQLGSVLDFGCGVGRLSRALAARFKKVISIDVSSSMLDEAQKVNQHIGNIDFIHNITEDLSIIPKNSIDCIYTNMVLQHMPMKRQIIYIKEFCRILRPKGILVMQTQAMSNLSSWKGWVYLLARNYGLDILHRIQFGTARVMEMHTVPKKTVLETLENENMSIINAERLDGGSTAFVRYRYFAEKI